MPGGGGYQQPYSVGDAFSYGWKKFVANLGPIVLATLVAILGSVIINGIGFALFGSGSSTTTKADGSVSTSFNVTGSLGSLVFSLLAVLFSLVITAGIIRATLEITRGRPVEMSTVFNLKNIGAVLITSILTTVMITIGLVLCVIPGLIAAVLTMFSLHFVIDKGMSPIDAIKASVSLVKNNLGSVVIFALLSLVAFIVGALLCGIGLLVAYPVVYIGMAYTYRHLQGEPVAP
ncbi:hypothetical protein [Demetria terragena]|uniref:hypothetical protein n=1 Tax=Demetria terragena TaxID=63959 RepID=UPI00035E0390|nr:hypothetical protein [Demetria terragena]